MEHPKMEIGTIRIIFPVESDEQAFELKKKVGAIFVEVKDAHISFSVGTMPQGQFDVRADRR